MIIDHVDDRNMIIVGRMDKKKVGDLWLVSGVMVIKWKMVLQSLFIFGSIYEVPNVGIKGTI